MKYLYSLIFWVCVVLLMGCSMEPGRNPNATIKIGDMAPSLRNLVYMQESEVSFGDENQDKVYIIEFWAT